jgi:hypothetical protein
MEKHTNILKENLIEEGLLRHVFINVCFSLSLSVAVFRKRNIPIERPPLVGEVSAKLLWVEGVAWSAQRIPTAVNS